MKAGPMLDAGGAVSPSFDLKQEDVFWADTIKAAPAF
jgi:hypothetical protein